MGEKVWVGVFGFKSMKLSVNVSAVSVRAWSVSVWVFGYGNRSMCGCEGVPESVTAQQRLVKRTVRIFQVILGTIKFKCLLG